MSGIRHRFQVKHSQGVDGKSNAIGMLIGFRMGARAELRNFHTNRWDILQYSCSVETYRMMWLDGIFEFYHFVVFTEYTFKQKTGKYPAKKQTNSCGAVKLSYQSLRYPAIFLLCWVLSHDVSWRNFQILPFCQCLQNILSNKKTGKYLAKKQAADFSFQLLRYSAIFLLCWDLLHDVAWWNFWILPFCQCLQNILSNKKLVNN